MAGFSSIAEISGLASDMALICGSDLIIALRRSGWESIASKMGESNGGADDGKEGGKGFMVVGEVTGEVEARGEEAGAVTEEECGVVWGRLLTK